MKFIGFMLCCIAGAIVGGFIPSDYFLPSLTALILGELGIFLVGRGGLIKTRR